MKVKTKKKKLCRFFWLFKLFPGCSPWTFLFSAWYYVNILFHHLCDRLKRWKIYFLSKVVIKVSTFYSSYFSYVFFYVSSNSRSNVLNFFSQNNKILNEKKKKKKKILSIRILPKFLRWCIHVAKAFFFFFFISICLSVIWAENEIRI